MSHNHAEMNRCIDQCLHCNRTCAETLQHCLQAGGAHTQADHVRLMMDCIEICRTSADFMIRGSELHVHTCGACAEVCQRCADDCQRLADEDPQMREHMQRCADECRRCAESCRQMSGAHA
ncbi:MAG TPA: four-helix bundle copper-binding protein [Tepidisphaeraceae bacterium]|jgi:hypothetical protein|nr:four-helix bundle copper-binding protein [Tepidisphaeraceae bacterium]